MTSLRRCLCSVTLWAYLPWVIPHNSEAAEIRGRVVDDASKEPLVSVELRVFRQGAEVTAANTETDEQGKFGPVAAPPGAYVLEAYRSGYLLAHLDLQLVDPGISVDLALKRLGRISGIVSDAFGQPLSGIQVQAISKSPSGLWEAIGRPVATDGRGFYLLQRLPRGTYVVTFDGKTFPENSSARLFTIEKGEEFEQADAIVSADGCQPLSGRITGGVADGLFQVLLVPRLEIAIPAAHVITDPKGEFLFSCVPVGSYELLASGPVVAQAANGGVLGAGPAFGKANVDIVGGSAPGPIDIRVGPEAAASLILRAAGKLDHCSQVGHAHFSSIEGWQTSSTEVDVNFQKPSVVRGLPPGRFLVTVTGLGDSCYPSDQTFVDAKSSPGGPVAVAVFPAGRVQGKASGAVVLQSTDRREDGNRVAIPAEDGTFVFAKIRPGRYRLTGGAVILDADVQPGADVFLDLTPKGDPSVP